MRELTNRTPSHASSQYINKKSELMLMRRATASV